MSKLTSLLLLLVVPTQAMAWNALGHKVVAEIAWQQLEPKQRQSVVDILRRHPRFAEDFVNKMPADVATAEKSAQDQWIFQHAGTWPDVIRGNREYDRPTWHYVNFPLFLNGERRISVNLSNDYPTQTAKDEYNCLQATKHCLAALESKAGADTKAIAYCWLFHLVGDMHQPMHSTALFSDRFPNGDRGGNEIPLARGRNLHALWDNLLGRQHYMRDVQREIAKLKADRDAWKVDLKADPETWIKESHALAKSVAYDPIILNAVRDTPVAAELQRIVLPETYMQEAGRVARRRIVAAGLRLGTLLDGKRADPPEEATNELSIAAPISPGPAAAVTTTLTHWLNVSTGVRHNSSCRHYDNTKDGRRCTVNEGKPCGICGG
jgi:hypothetical protein